MITFKSLKLNVSNTKHSKSNCIYKKRQIMFRFLFGFQVSGYSGWVVRVFGWEKVTR
ncbi:hypothetical protein HanRHA438_Chr15g0733071 [Helianthus annuus]|nr:hypothetical protein HanRHA438_Chr15g0733071 [Helianthus annuus]